MDCPSCKVPLQKGCLLHDDETEMYLRQYKCPTNECPYYKNIHTNKPITLRDRNLFNKKYPPFEYDIEKKVYTVDNSTFTIGTGTCMMCNDIKKVLSTRSISLIYDFTMMEVQLCEKCIQELFKCFV